MIDQNTLKRFFNYDPETGEFKRIAFVDNRGVIYPRESKVGRKDQHGYHITVINNKRYKVHRLIFIYMTGSVPSKYVQHINGDKDDNRWLNLRLVDRTYIQRNMKLRSDNSLGYTGVHWCKQLGKYHAQITVSGKHIHLGYFSDIGDAVIARNHAEVKYGFRSTIGEPSWGE